MSLNDHILGRLLSGAIGNMLGRPYEQSSGTSHFPHLRECPSLMIQLTLATCEAIVEEELVSPAHIAKKFVSISNVAN